MITAAEIKFIKSLSQKKFRDEHGLFVVEGEKLVQEALRSGFKVEKVYRKEEIGEAAMARISGLSSPSPALALVRKPEDLSSAKLPSSGLFLALDGIRDPGNLGTILRLADWFGVDWIFASDADSRYPTSDIYNPKVVQATMGAIFRTRLVYAPLPEIAQLFINEGMEVYGTFLDGKPIYEESLKGEGLIVMGNESEGISPEMAACVTRRLTIPSYPVGVPTSESLNVATATAITLSEFRRR